MKQFITTKIRPLIQRFGIDVVRHQKKDSYTSLYLSKFSEQNIRIYNAVKPYTMTNLEKVDGLIESVRYIIENKIDGAMVECGVWKGGSAMAMALTLKELGFENRNLFLYDTFSGMSKPKDVDVSFNGNKALKHFSKTKISEDSSNWCLSSLDEVKENLFSTGYPKENIHFIEGKVEETIPKNVPIEIALLRLVS